jgi:hypothetical protein
MPILKAFFFTVLLIAGIIAIPFVVPILIVVGVFVGIYAMLKVDALLEDEDDDDSI